MLHVKKLRLTIRDTDRVLLRDVSFALQKENKTAIIGEEGNGKSTLLRVLHDAEAAGAFVKIEGTIHKGGLTTGYLPQQIPDAMLNRTTESLLLSNPADFDYAYYYRLLEEMDLP